MTTVELAQRLIDKSTIASLDKAEMGELLTLSDTINQAIQEYFFAVPSIYRQTTISSTHEAPRTVSIDVTNGSNVVAGNPFLDTDRGNTIAISGDALKYNEITGNGTLLNDYRGSTGSVSATIYDDAIAITDLQIERLVSHPRVLDNRTELKNAKQYRNNNRHYGEYTSINENRSIGRYPLFYEINPTGASRVTDALMIIRFDPIPIHAFTVNFEAEIRAITYDWRNMHQTPLQLPTALDDSVIHRTLIPMTLGKLAGSELWGTGPEVAANYISRGERALSHARSLPDTLEKPARKVRTRRNF